MMGGGFGGCTINLMKTDQAENIFEILSEAYFKKFGITPDLLKVEPSDGVFLSRFV
jgi:galactokinase